MLLIFIVENIDIEQQDFGKIKFHIQPLDHINFLENTDEFGNIIFYFSCNNR